MELYFSCLSSFPEALEFLSGKNTLRLLIIMHNLQYIITYQKNTRKTYFFGIIEPAWGVSDSQFHDMCSFWEVTWKTAQFISASANYMCPPSLYAKCMCAFPRERVWWVVLNPRYWIELVPIISGSLMFNPPGTSFSLDSFLFQFMGVVAARAVVTCLMKYVPKQCERELGWRERAQKTALQNVADIYGFVNSLNSFSTYFSLVSFEKICFNLFKSVWLSVVYTDLPVQSLKWLVIFTNDSFNSKKTELLRVRTRYKSAVSLIVSSLLLDETESKVNKGFNKGSASKWCQKVEVPQYFYILLLCPFCDLYLENIICIS